MPETFLLIEPLIDDLCNLFPGDYIHLGGDEVAPESWKNSPAVEALKTKYDLETNQDVASWFINKLSAKVESNGKKTAAWQEAEEGSYHEKRSDKLLFSWQNLESGYKLARKGFKVVLCPAEHIYFDMAQSQTYSDRGVNWAAIVSLEDTVDWQIIPSDEPELLQFILNLPKERHSFLFFFKLETNCRKSQKKKQKLFSLFETLFLGEIL